MKELQRSIRMYQAALSDEISAARRSGGDRVRISDGKLIGRTQIKWLYEFRLDTETWVPDDCGIEVQHGSVSVAGSVVLVEGFSIVLELEEQLEAPIRRATLVIRLWYILESLSRRLTDASQRPLRGKHDLLLLSKAGRGSAGVQGKPGKYDGLNHDQADAVGRALSNAVSFIWGPPGTGKTKTVGRILAETERRGERALLVAHSNAAVDVAMLAVASLYSGPPQQMAGKVYRFGTPRLLAVRDHEWLSHDAVLRISNPTMAARIDELRQLVQELRERNQTGRLESARGELRALRESASEAATITAKSARILGCTLAKLATHEFWEDYHPDVVVLDEASMASIPFVALAASTATTRFVVAGDFMQLPPVVLAQTESAQLWLERHAFDYAGIPESVRRQTADPRMTILRTQYRMHRQIAGSVSSVFYGGLLETDDAAHAAAEAVASRPPADSHPILVVDSGRLHPQCPQEPHQTGSSRFNMTHAAIDMALLATATESNHKSIAVISPFRAQSRLLRLLADDAGFGEQVVVSTVHRFQGSEADVVILDLCSAPPHSKLGPLLGGLPSSVAGRLVNVAASRAKGKLLVVADVQHIRSKASATDAIKLLLDEFERLGVPTTTMNSGALSKGLAGERVNTIMGLEPNSLWASSAADSATKASEVSLTLASTQAPPKWVARAASRKARVVFRGQQLHHAWSGLASSHHIPVNVQWNSCLIDRQTLWFELGDQRSTLWMKGPLSTAYAGELLRVVPEHNMVPSKADPSADNGQVESSWLIPCHKCGGQLWLEEGHYGAYLRCQEQSCRSTQSLTPAVASQVLEVMKVRCERCSGIPVVRKGYRGLFIRCGQSDCDWIRDFKDFF